MKILIIGGAGFIGSHLCEAYVQNNNVTSIDNYISGKKDNHIPGVEYLNMDAKDILSIKADFNLIFHFGEYSRVEKSLEKINFVLQNNSLPILNVLKFTKLSNAKLIYAGSSTKFSDDGEDENKYIFDINILEKINIEAHIPSLSGRIRSLLNFIVSSVISHMRLHIFIMSMEVERTLMVSMQL